MTTLLPFLCPEPDRLLPRQQRRQLSGDELPEGHLQRLAPTVVAQRLEVQHLAAIAEPRWNLINADRKRWEDTASEAAGRETYLMLKLNQAISNLEKQRQENESLRDRLNEFLVSGSQPHRPNRLEAVFFPCSFYDEEFMSYLR